MEDPEAPWAFAVALLRIPEGFQNKTQQLLSIHARLVRYLASTSRLPPLNRTPKYY